jgi:hypothetical protein
MSPRKVSHARTDSSHSPGFNKQQTLRRFQPRILQGVLLLAGLLMSMQAFATTLVYKSFDDLVKEADGIVAGRVASIESRYNPKHEIYTFVTIDQLSVLGGSYQGPTLTLRLKGGQVDNNIAQIVGSPEFKLNEQVVLFVEGNGQYMVPLVGWTQGVFRVSQDAATGQQVILDHEGNRVLNVVGSEIVKDLKTQPAASIVGQQNKILSIASENKGGGGLADGKLQTLSSLPGPIEVLTPMPTMTSQSFLGVIKKSAAAKTLQRALTSVNPGDFSLPLNSNSDSSIGPKIPVVEVPSLHTPTKPQPKPAPQTPNQF